MWPFQKKTAPVPPPPHPPLGMPPAQYKAAQDAYVDKFDKLVKPTQQTEVEAAKVAADFGKMVITYLVLGNSGGLAALVVLAPLMHNVNQVWLAQQLLTATAFAGGAALGVALAVVAHFNYSSHAGAFGMQWQRHDNWVMAVEFGLAPQWQRATDEWLAHMQQKANRRADLTNALSVVVFMASAASWVYGAVSLAMSVIGSGST